MPTRWMDDKDAFDFLAARPEGRLATCDKAGQPFITPVNHLVHDGKIYFHSKLTGRKLNNIAENNRVCFEVSEVVKLTVSHDRPCGCSTRYTSVLAFGSARVLPDGADKTALLNLLVAKHADGMPFAPVEESHAVECAVVEISIDEISGKKNIDSE